MALTTAIPIVPDGSWAVYNEVERFLLDEKHHEGAFAPTYEELGQLTRLVADLRSDIGHLETFVEDLDELIEEGIGELRNADARKERA